MSEWNSVLAVYWALWAVDGVRVARRRGFSATSGWRATRADLHYLWISWPGFSPGSWRIVAADVPLSLSPAGVCNRPAGCAGRPVEAPAAAQSWRWEDVRAADAAAGWLRINGARFCPDTGHVTAPQLLELAHLAPAARAHRIHRLLRRWLRPAHLRRRARVLAGRTTAPAMLNSFVVVLVAALSLYVVFDGSGRVSPAVAAALAQALPWLVGCAVVLHLSAAVTAWRALRWLKPVAPDRRRPALVSALLLPPQALRLRAILGDGFFPPQHPLAVALAFTDGAARKQWVFQTLADLSWPIGDRSDPPLAREIAAWYRSALEERLRPLLVAAKIDAQELLAAPAPDAAGGCAYCPRCRDQFVAGPRECPHGVTLRPVARPVDRGS